jgi:hypothetical protein
VVVGDLDIVGVAVGEMKADSPRVVDGNRILPCPLSLERVKPVAWRDLEIIKPSRQVDVLQLPSCSLDHIRRKPSRLASRVQPLRVPIRERLDHAVSVLCHVTRVKARDLPRSPVIQLYFGNRETSPKPHSQTRAVLGRRRLGTDFTSYSLMGRRLRYTPDGGALVEVTCRTLHSRYLLRPGRALDEVIVGVLGRAQRLYEVRCCGYVFAMSQS